jgi:hypothetical protein
VAWAQHLLLFINKYINIILKYNNILRKAQKAGGIKDALEMQRSGSI